MKDFEQKLLQKNPKELDNKKVSGYSANTE